MHIIDGVDRLKELVGTHLGESTWRTVTQIDVDLFADLTGDHQWIHVDVEAAKDSAFGGTVAHGFFSLGLLPVMASDVFRWEGWSMTLNYGVNKLRFPSPLPVGSRIRSSFDLAAVTETRVGYLTQYDSTVEIEGGAKPALFAQWLVVLVP